MSFGLGVGLATTSGEGCWPNAFFRRLGIALQEVIGQALETLSTQDALGCFTHWGYPPAQASGRSWADSTFLLPAVGVLRHQLYFLKTLSY
jgi:hypothetical protein